MFLRSDGVIGLWQQSWRGSVLLNFPEKVTVQSDLDRRGFSVKDSLFCLKMLMSNT